MDKISRTKTDLLMREWAEMVRECRSSRLTGSLSIVVVKKIRKGRDN